VNEPRATTERHASIVLIGPRGAGKTTVGRKLARRLGWTFLDLDEMIQAAGGRTIAELFAETGEPSFRRAEQEAIRSLNPEGPAVISVGAGAVEDSKNRMRLGMLGTVVYLHAASEICRSRVAGDPASATGRPPLPPAAGAPEQRARRRRRHYEQLASHSVDTTDLTPDEVCEAVIRQLHPRPRRTS
jgi:shikimate kinase